MYAIHNFLGRSKHFDIADYVGRGELSERQQRLGTLLNQYKKLAERHNIAIVYTNLYVAPFFNLVT